MDLHNDGVSMYGHRKRANCREIRSKDPRKLTNFVQIVKVGLG
jgi:hypothetical protein